MAVDTGALRTCLGCFASGVTVVSYATTDGPRGFTANSFTSVSLEPPLVLVSVARHGRGHDLLAERPFTVNILRAEQEALARHFATRDHDMVVEWVDGDAGPRLAGVLAYLACEPWAAHPAGDHTIYLGRVVALDSTESDALGFFRSRFVPVAQPLPSQPAPRFDPFELPYDAL
jgi:flavin reductase